ncbi:hypothetical protein NLI96_g3077 [Meripilus lineatus]|uniref:DUF6534 domain-containing protein n=1 Tax=Meripilus lineatus TaxID=2056292 RepID=A0AAD5V7H2_9APHY|nr:hypothetical protein NLI96_g3077 [Physisporinus lineatus]
MSTSDNNINETLGAIFFGVTSIQTKTYFTRRRKDHVFAKSLILLLWVLDLLHFVLVTEVAYWYNVRNHTNLDAFKERHWSFTAHMFVQATSDIIVRGVFAHRVWRLGERNVPTLVVTVVIALAAYVGIMITAVRIAHTDGLVELNRLSSLIYFSLATNAVADIIVSGSLFYLLRDSHQRASFKRTQTMIQSLIIYTINAGALNCICALLSLICYATMPNNFIFYVFYSVAPKLFLNSLLAMINARHLSSNPDESDPFSIPLSNTSSGGRIDFRTRSHQVRPDQELYFLPVSPQTIDIHIDTTTDRKVDDVLLQQQSNTDAAIDIKAVDTAEGGSWPAPVASNRIDAAQ